MSNDDVVEVTPGPPTRRRGRMLAVAAVVVVLGTGSGVAAWAATRAPGSPDPGGSASGSTVACPGGVSDPRGPTFDLAGLVPALPSASRVDGRLVPARGPVDGVVCAYPGFRALDAQAILDPTEPLAAKLVALLQRATPFASDQSVACPDVVAPTTEYLVGLRYTDGVVWVATPGACTGSTNGSTSTGTDAGPAVAAVLATDPSASVPPVVGSTFPGSPGSPAPSGSVVPLPSETPPADPFAACLTPAPRKPTPVDRLVPFTPTAVRICHAPVGPVERATTVVDRPAAVAVALADAVDALPPRAPDTACPDIGGETWRLLFTAAGGRQASLLVDAGGCRTVSVDGRVVQADDALFALLDAND